MLCEGYLPEPYRKQDSAVNVAASVELSGAKVQPKRNGAQPNPMINTSTMMKIFYF